LIFVAIIVAIFVNLNLCPDPRSDALALISDARELGYVLMFMGVERINPNPDYVGIVCSVLLPRTPTSFLMIGCAEASDAPSYR
jgi:hypothetical protein